MRKVQRGELLDYQTYSDQRDDIRKRMMQVKAPRRIHVGDHLTFLFENADTMRYQVQEMMRAEKIVKESSIQHELDTYNGLLGGEGELGCALLIEIEDETKRKKLLTEWVPLPKHLYVKLEDGSKVYAAYDTSQVDDARLSAVQYLKFDTKGAVPIAVGTDFDALVAEAKLSATQRGALAEDLRTPDRS